MFRIQNVCTNLKNHMIGELIQTIKFNEWKS